MSCHILMETIAPCVSIVNKQIDVSGGASRPLGVAPLLLSQIKKTGANYFTKILLDSGESRWH